MLLDTLHTSHAWNRPSLISSHCHSHPRSNIPLENSLGSCHQKSELQCPGSFTSSQATDLLTMVSLFTSHICGSLLCVPHSQYPDSMEEGEEFPHCSWAPELMAGYPKDLCASSWGQAAA